MKTLGDILGKHKGYQKLLSDKRLLDRINQHWKSISGRLSESLIPVSIHRGVLVLETDNLMWKTELAFYEDQVLSRLKEVLKKPFVKKLKVSLSTESKKCEKKCDSVSKHRTFEEKIRDSVSEKVRKGFLLCTFCSSMYVEKGNVCDFCRISKGC